MDRERALGLARAWAQGHVCTLRHGEAQEYHELFISLLEELPPNEPLTLDELRKMDGEPVWVRCLKPSQYADPPVRWRILEKSIAGHFGVWNGDGALIERTYGVDWLAYRRSPEQGDNHG